MGILTPETKKLRQLLSVGKGYWNYNHETQTLTGFFSTGIDAMAAAGSLDWYDTKEAPITEIASNLHYVEKAKVSAEYVVELENSLHKAKFKEFSIARGQDLNAAQTQAEKQLPAIVARAEGAWKNIVTEAEKYAGETHKSSKETTEILTKIKELVMQLATKDGNWQRSINQLVNQVKSAQDQGQAI